MRSTPGAPSLSAFLVTYSLLKVKTVFMSFIRVFKLYQGLNEFCEKQGYILTSFYLVTVSRTLTAVTNCVVRNVQ